MNREAWNVAVRGAAKSRTWLSGWTKLITFCNRPHSFLFWLLHTHSQFFVKFPMITAWHRLILLTFQKNYIYMWSLLTSASQVAQWLKKKKIYLEMLEMHNMSFDPWVRKTPWSRKWLTPVSLPGEFHGQRSLVGLGGCLFEIFWLICLDITRK